MESRNNLQSQINQSGEGDPAGQANGKQQLHEADPRNVMLVNDPTTQIQTVKLPQDSEEKADKINNSGENHVE